MDDKKLLLSTHDHRDAEEMIRALELFLQIYADRDNWREEYRGEPPHYLRKGMRLAFDPSNVVDGYRFAEEALAALARFRRRRDSREPTEILWRLDVEAAPRDVWLWGWIAGSEDGDFTSPVQLTVPPLPTERVAEMVAAADELAVVTGAAAVIREPVWCYRFDNVPVPAALTVLKWAPDPAKLTPEEWRTASGSPRTARQLVTDLVI